MQCKYHWAMHIAQSCVNFIDTVSSVVIVFLLYDFIGKLQNGGLQLNTIVFTITLNNLFTNLVTMIGGYNYIL